LTTDAVDGSAEGQRMVDQELDEDVKLKVRSWLAADPRPPPVPM